MGGGGGGGGPVCLLDVQCFGLCVVFKMNKTVILHMCTQYAQHHYIQHLPKHCTLSRGRSR